MPARVIELCDALATYIGSSTYPFTFNVLRQNPAHHRLESTIQTYLYIYPGPEGPTTGTRRQWLHTYSARLHLVNYVDNAVGQNEIDDLFLLMESILDSLKAPVISGMSMLEFSTEDNPEEPYVNEQLVQMNLAQSVRRVIYQEMR